MVRWSEEDYDRHMQLKGKTKRKSTKKRKYSNKKVYFDRQSERVLSGMYYEKEIEESKKKEDYIKFDSMLECSYYRELLLLKKAGEVKEIELQPKFTLIPKFIKNGMTISAITYSADFKVTYEDRVEIVDIKGMVTDQFRLKWKMFEYKFPNLRLKVINKYGKEIPLYKNRGK